MLTFFKGQVNQYYLVEASEKFNSEEVEKLQWLFGDAQIVNANSLEGLFIGPRREMITPWSTNAVEITQNMGLSGILRIEEFQLAGSEYDFDPMLQALYKGLDQQSLDILHDPEPIIKIQNISEYNQSEGLALSDEEVKYLDELAVKLGRELTDSEVFGFSQVNSEHCRHKIFNGTFIIDGQEMPESLFKLIKKTSAVNPNKIVSAYKDNVSFVEGPRVEQFAPDSHDKADYFSTKDFDSVISLKAETHNFPTTVEPFNGAATGAGGEIRDRLAGGKGSIPLAGTAVYMTSYSRLEEDRDWETNMQERKWLYQTPMDILIKASNGASDFGNKFGQPLISGSVLTFEHEEQEFKYGFDKVIMLAGGIGFAKKVDALKGDPEQGDKIVILGGDNYRIGMGGSAVSSVDTGEFESKVELNAIQRSNPEMQKRAMNAIRAMVEKDENPIVSIHDHGAGGHLNSLSELVEETGGTIYTDKLPVGDPTLSDKEIVGNESQERMGLVMKDENLELLKRVADRERSPMYVVGEATGDHQFKFENSQTKNTPIDLQIDDMFGNPPKTIMEDKSVNKKYEELSYSDADIHVYLDKVLQLEAVASKDWLTNKVDRSVTGKVAKQQTCGSLQLPLNDVGVMALDYRGKYGVATSIGHSPVSALIDPEAGSKNSIAESLTNLVWAPLTDKIKGVSLSANWMWPAKNEGEDARLYRAVKAVSEFAIELGINIPTGKDSLSMTQKYDDGKVFAPGTVIISAGAEVSDVKKVVEPVLKLNSSSKLIYVNLSSDDLKLGGSSFAQILKKIGESAPTVTDSKKFVDGFNYIQELIEDEKVIAGHDISAGGMITALLEMCFAENNIGLDLDLSKFEGNDLTKILFAENASVLMQVENAEEIVAKFNLLGIESYVFGSVENSNEVKISFNESVNTFGVESLRKTWSKTSYLLDRKQSGEKLAKERFDNLGKLPLKYKMPQHFTGKLVDLGIDPNRKERSGVKAAIIREKGVNGDREMAYSLHLAGFDVKDVHMTDLISGRENLEDVSMIVFVGGFSNSDVLGSAKGWAGAFKYNEKAKNALENFYSRQDTMSLGVCNGCQLMMEMGLINPDHSEKPKMLHNDSHKFESGFVSMNIPANDNIMLNTLSDTQMGIWIAHGEGKFSFPYSEDKYNIVGKYAYNTYPANPNGSDFNTAALSSDDGRHLAMMPHLERAIFPWNWAAYEEGLEHEISPWIEAFINARKWIEKN
jgi:phosphoribosylformylglycinamidine synthase